MELRTLSIGRKAVIFDITMNSGSTDETAAMEERRITAHEEPLPSLTKAFAALAAPFCHILEFEPGYATGLTVTKIIVTRTKHGTRSVKLCAKKQLDVRTELLHSMDCPFVQIDKPADGESGDVQVEKKYVTLILKALHEAEKYAEGDRSQTLLNFNDAKAALQATADIGGRDMFAND